ncbi:hypothetical protein L249_2297 [Ophiocordyceps polyrhachis-furcata BCC 54312]|uniref:DUF1763-domain-containing protein n=1 Tax=Ophiocordyceps polyrhachis-furcata BCC 54312 TaxID=1330021 RepID=A0A367LPU0_9HYPO|nr:hypothetical protein L249_2297 [Ophiocordyceps polyrhachis-furcata BCC 54312]
MTTSSIDVIHAYRHLYRSLLQAVQHAAPARYAGRDLLREAFRARGATLSPVGVKRTLWFLQAAAREAGLEHKILKNLLRVRTVQFASTSDWRKRFQDSQFKKDPMQEERAAAERHYQMTIAMLNSSMGLCLR